MSPLEVLFFAIVGGFLGGMLVTLPTWVRVANEVIRHGWRNDR